MSSSVPASTTAPFGTVEAPTMIVAETVDGVFTAPRAEPVRPLALHPFAHALHYGSACFEGLKAHRGDDGVVRIFRADAHAARLCASARSLHLPDPGERLVLDMIAAVVSENLEHVPDAPGALYVRPVLLGTEPNIGAAAAPSSEALLIVVASPVGDYFARGQRPLTLYVETDLPRTTPQFGRIKTGANYAMALGPTLRARAEHDADQILFAPGGDVQETGAANFLLLDEERVVTRSLDATFLHGVTRDSVLTLARDLGLTVEERHVTVEELRAWAAHGEAALSGTAAVLSGVGTLVIGGDRVTVGDGEVGVVTQRLRAVLHDIQRGLRDDVHGWTLAVGA